MIERCTGDDGRWLQEYHHCIKVCGDDAVIPDIDVLRDVSILHCRTVMYARIRR